MNNQYFAGLDVGLKNTAICVVDDRGNQLDSFEVETDPIVISNKLKQLNLPSICLGLETGQLSIYLSRSLRDMGWELACMDARQVAAALSVQINKTDKNDAYGIAHLLRCGLYREVHVKSEEACDRRVLLASRRQLMEQAASLESSIRGLLKIYGVKLGAARRAAFIQKVTQEIASLRADGRLGIEALLTALQQVRLSCSELDNRVKESARQDARCRLLMSMPGVGPLTSSLLVTTLDDAERFDKSRSVGAYLGLTPRQYSSGETMRQGRISKCGPAECRAMLYEAAHCLLYFYKGSSKLKQWGQKLAKQKGMKKAVVAVARKMAVILHTMLVTNQPYDDSKLAAR